MHMPDFVGFACSATQALLGMECKTAMTVLGTACLLVSHPFLKCTKIELDMLFWNCFQACAFIATICNHWQLCAFLVGLGAPIVGNKLRISSTTGSGNLKIKGMFWRNQKILQVLN